MDALDYIHNTITEQSVTCDVLRPADDGSTVYDDGFTETGERVNVAVFQPSSSSTVTTEGTGQDVSLTGHLVPSYDKNGDLTVVVEVGDRLRVTDNTAKQYEVRTKDGVPNDLDPEVWQLGLEPANSSE